jgi:hypothetical protein
MFALLPGCEGSTGIVLTDTIEGALSGGLPTLFQFIRDNLESGVDPIGTPEPSPTVWYEPERQPARA